MVIPLIVVSTFVTFWKETAINNANKYRNEKLPGAEAQVDKILKEAEAKHNHASDVCLNLTFSRRNNTVYIHHADYRTDASLRNAL